jgi:hypothetical protein
VVVIGNVHPTTVAIAIGAIDANMDYKPVFK